MKDLSRIKQNEKGYYIEYIHKSGRQKGYVEKYYGKILICPLCKESYFATNQALKRNEGKRCSYDCHNKGKDNPHYNKHLPRKTRKKISKTLMGHIVLEKSRKKISKGHKNKPCPKKVKEYLSRYFKGRYTGNKSSQWKGGVSDLPYPPEFNEMLKENIRERDNYTCQYPRCKKKQNGRAHCTHHIDYNKNNLDPPNLITLCNKHNIEVNQNRKYWMNYFSKIMKIKYKEGNAT